MSLLAQLEHFGLSDKEARVYVSALELGPAPVQSISRKAAVNRATTYVQIASLTGRGLMSSFEKGKKRMFVAEAPDRLATLYEDELIHLKEKEKVLQQILPGLKQLRPAGDLPAVRLFEGHDGLEAVRQEFLQAKPKESLFLYGMDFYRRSVPEESRKRQFERRKALGIGGKSIISGTASHMPQGPEDRLRLQRREVSAELYDVPGELVIYDNKVVLLSYKGEPVAVVIENPELRKVVEALYRLAWEKVKGQPAV